MNNNIIKTLIRIETKLDEVIAALHDYDGDEWSEPNDALKKSAAQYNEIIHHVSNKEADEDAFDDYGMRVVGDKDRDNNTQDNKHVGEKKRNPKQSPREGYTDATPFIKTKDRRKYYKPKNKG
jgi:hypothetical protein